MNTEMISAFVAEHGTAVYLGILLYFGVVSLVSAIVTVADKMYAKKAGHRRIPESTLISYAAFGGSLAMLLTMLLIRHKTKHPKFMVGIPLILLFQAVILLWITVRLRSMGF
jgi:uncharacterized membrane protein YsdA (DUF1294 family)